MFKSGDIARFIFFALLVFGLAFSAGCGDDDDDDNDDGQIPDDDVDDDDADDDLDDDADDDADDDVNDDADDDFDDDVNDDVDDDIDDDLDDDLDDDTEVLLEWIDGGAVGRDGVTFAVASDGTQYMAAAKARILFLNKKTVGNSWESQLVAYFAATPKMAVDSAGYVHLLYRHLEEPGLVYATNASGAWSFERIEDGEFEDMQYRIAAGADNRAHITFLTRNPGNNELIFHYRVSNGRAWDESIIAEGSQAGKYHDLVLDSGGNPHVAYNYDYSVYYAANAGASWTTELVDTQYYYVDPVALALDANDHAFIAWTRGSYSDGIMRYATNQSGDWVVEDIVASEQRGLDLGVDDDGRIHIAFMSSKTSLSYVTNESGDWVQSVVDTWPEDSEIPPVVAFDADGNFVIGYFRFETYCLGSAWCAQRQGEGFIVEVVDQGKTVGANCILELDDQSNPLISYYDHHDIDFKFTRKVGENWEIETIDDADYAGGGADSCVDDYGAVHISYSSPELVGVNYATNARGDWAIQQIPDDEVDGVGSTAIDVDSGGHVHIIYNAPDYRWDRIKYLTNKSGAWVGVTIEESDNYMEIPAIVATDDGLIHIAYSGYHYYHDGGETGLLYGASQNSSWDMTLVDYYGDGCDMLIDSGGAAHIAYYDYNGYVWYSTNQSGEFAIDVVDGAGEAITYTRPSMDMDNRAVLHIVYNYWSLGLGYATKKEGVWFNTVIPKTSSGSKYASLKIDDRGRAHVAYHGDEALWHVRFGRDYGSPSINVRDSMEVGR